MISMMLIQALNFKHTYLNLKDFGELHFTNRPDIKHACGLIKRAIAFKNPNDWKPALGNKEHDLRKLQASAPPSSQDG